MIGTGPLPAGKPPCEALLPPILRLALVAFAIWLPTACGNPVALDVRSPPAATIHPGEISGVVDWKPLAVTSAEAEQNAQRLCAEHGLRAAIIGVKDVRGTQAKLYYSCR